MANRSNSVSNTTAKLFVIIAVLGVILSGCRSSERDQDTTIEFTRSFWSNSNKINHVLRQIHGVALVDSVVNGNLDTNLVSAVCFDSLSYEYDNKFFPVYPNQLNIHFNDSITCENTAIQSGVIRTVFSGPFAQVGTQIEVEFDNYRSNGIEIMGTLKMELFKNKFDSLAYLVTFENLAFVDHSKPALNRSYLAGSIEWVQWIGNSTPEATDDDFTISGQGVGTAYNGVNYNFSSDLAVLFNHTCNYETTGSYILSTSTNADRICNFGDGTCDNKMLVTIEPGVADTETEIN